MFKKFFLSLLLITSNAFALTDVGQPNAFAIIDTIEAAGGLNCTDEIDLSSGINTLTVSTLNTDFTGMIEVYVKHQPGGDYKARAASADYAITDADRTGVIEVGVTGYNYAKVCGDVAVSDVEVSIIGARGVSVIKGVSDTVFTAGGGGGGDASAANQVTGNGYLIDIKGYTDGLEGQLTSLLAKDFATTAKQDTGNSYLGSLDSKFFESQKYLEDTLSGIDSVEFDVEGMVAARILLNGTAEVEVMGSFDGVTYPTGSFVMCDALNGTDGNGPTLSGSGQYNCDVSVYKKIKASIIADSVDIIIAASPVPFGVPSQPNGYTYTNTLILGNALGLGITETDFGGGTVGLDVNIANTSIPVTGTFFQATQPVSAVALTNIDSKTPALGQATMAVSSPVVIASNQSAVPVSGTFWQVTQPVSGTLAVSNSFALDATLVALSAKFSALGQNTMANSQPVVIASNQSAVPVSGTFWQATQPVSGTFWQATQPVSGTVAVSNSFALDATLTGGTQQTKITDGTDIAEVTAASTAAAAANKSLVVSQNPSGGNPCLNPSATLVSATGATSGTSAVQIVALSGSTKIYLCSLSVIGVSGTNPTFSLVQGTGSNCATGQTVLVQSWATTAGAIYAFANPVAVGVAGNALCYLDTGTTPVQRYTLTYVQQ